MPLTSTAEDSARAVALMCQAGVDAILVLGGDGTHRVVAKSCGDVPICALSTGTNNVFPEMREATVAGMATGLVATGRGSIDQRRRCLGGSEKDVPAQDLQLGIAELRRRGLNRALLAWNLTLACDRTKT